LEETYVFLNDIDFSKEEISKYTSSNFSIFSMNYKVHKFLENLSVEHIIADDLLDEDDSDLVFDKTVSLYEWYKQNDVFDKMDFQGINLFSVLDDTEFHTFMIIKLREIITLQKILENKLPKRIVASKQLIDIIQKIISKDVDFVEIPSSKVDEMTFDHIEVKFDIWKIPVSLKFSRNFYTRVKSLIENIICSTNHLWASDSKEKSSVLLLEFNPSQYTELINQISKTTNSQIVMFNNRRSSIWNKKSISVLKKSNSKVLSTSHILNKKELHFLDGQKKKYSKILDEILLSIDTYSIFSIKNIQFWNLIKSELIRTYKKRLDWYLELIFGTKKFFTNNKIDYVLSLNAVGETEKTVLKLRNKNTISVMLEHAFANYTKEISRYDILSSYTLFPHKIAVWGNVQKKYLTQVRNISEDRIIACGSPRHDNFFNDSINYDSSGNDTILLCPRPIVEVAGHYGTNAFTTYELVLKKVIHQLRQIKHTNIIVKLHPGDIEHNNLIKDVIQKIDSQILISNTKSIHELIYDSKLVLVISPDGFDPSTVILESIILKRPVINLVLDDKFYDFSYEKHNAVMSISPENNLEEEIQKILNDSTFRNEIIENGKNFLNDYLSNHKNAAKSLANELLKLQNHINHL
tara:strand:- start:1983 stop:3887 length:1905 start_codon:yes stop_codon:yes gene_type:complete